jgi:hypothetical protein
MKARLRGLSMPEFGCATRHLIKQQRVARIDHRRDCEGMLMERLAQCHCGSLRAITSGEPLLVGICHCKACQRRTGAVAASVAGFAKAEVTIGRPNKGLRSAWTIWTEGSLLFLPQLWNIPHMRVVGVKPALHSPNQKSCSRRLIGLGASPLVLFKLRSTAHRCRPVELWATHCVVQAQRQIHRVLSATYTVVARARFPIKIAALQ